MPKFWLPLLTIIIVVLLIANIAAIIIVKDSDGDHALIYSAGVLSVGLAQALKKWFKS